MTWRSLPRPRLGAATWASMHRHQAAQHGIVPSFFRYPIRHLTLLDGADNRLAALADIHSIDHYLLLTLAAVMLQSVELGIEDAKEFNCEVATYVQRGEVIGLLGAPGEIHGEIIGNHHLCRQHSLDFILGTNAVDG